MQIKHIHILLFTIVYTLNFVSNMYATETILTTDKVAILATNEDINGYLSLNVSVGDIIAGIISPPNTWITTEISQGMGITTIGKPSYCTNLIGDIVILWTYLDAFYRANIAAAILLHNDPTWYITSLTYYTTMNANSDQSLACDTFGNVVASWSARDDVSEQNMLFVAMDSITTTTVWSTPVALSL